MKTLSTLAKRCKLIPKLVLVAAVLLGSVGAAQAAYHGALAYNHNTGAWGYSYDYPNQWSANNRALSECGYGCDLVVQFYNSCAAYATGWSGNWG